jgi:hypothetical protein
MHRRACKLAKGQHGIGLTRSIVLRQLCCCLWHLLLALVLQR